jgi:hypothetical protein
MNNIELSEEEQKLLGRDKYLISLALEHHIDTLEGLAEAHKAHEDMTRVITGIPNKP